MTKLLPQGGKVFLQSDVCEVSENMRNMFELHAGSSYELSPLHQQEGATFQMDSSQVEPQSIQDLQRRREQEKRRKMEEEVCTRGAGFHMGSSSPAQRG